MSSTRGSAVRPPRRDAPAQVLGPHGRCSGPRGRARRRRRLALLRAALGFSVRRDIRSGRTLARRVARAACGARAHDRRPCASRAPPGGRLAGAAFPGRDPPGRRRAPAGRVAGGPGRDPGAPRRQRLDCAGRARGGLARGQERSQPLAVLPDRARPAARLRPAGARSTAPSAAACSSSTAPTPREGRAPRATSSCRTGSWSSSSSRTRWPRPSSAASASRVRGVGVTRQVGLRELTSTGFW